MTGQCVKHQFDMAQGTCQMCGYLYCERCLVFVKGPKKPGLCVACALSASGVRSTAANPPLMPGRDRRRAERERRKADRKAAKQAAKEEGGAPLPPPPAPPGVVPPPPRSVHRRSSSAGWGRPASDG